MDRRSSGRSYTHSVSLGRRSILGLMGRIASDRMPTQIAARVINAARRVKVEEFETEAMNFRQEVVEWVIPRGRLSDFCSPESLPQPCRAGIGLVNRNSAIRAPNW